jgi:hypothetical protein
MLFEPHKQLKLLSVRPRLETMAGAMSLASGASVGTGGDLGSGRALVLSSGESKHGEKVAFR